MQALMAEGRLATSEPSVSSVPEQARAKTSRMSTPRSVAQWETSLPTPRSRTPSMQPSRSLPGADSPLRDASPLPVPTLPSFFGLLETMRQGGPSRRRTGTGLSG